MRAFEEIRLFLIIACVVSWNISAHAGSETSAPWSAADDHFDADEMAHSRKMVQKHHGATKTYLIEVDRLEFQTADETDTFLWDLQGWYGGDINKFKLKSEGDYSFAEDAFEEAELQALWSRAVTSFFDLHAGVRWDFEPDRRTHGVVGASGHVPFGVEADASLFVSGEGDVTARLEAEYDLRVTQQLILKPRLELEVSAQSIPEVGVGKGVSGIDLGIRARYEIKPEIAPYVGVEWQASFGDTADLVRASGETARQTVFLVGITAWF